MTAPLVAALVVLALLATACAVWMWLARAHRDESTRISATNRRRKV
ncbi:MAG TPA: hypothetical protein VM681_08845 [Candidatus Thermoplasmatota archaeon]|nr:hypothetical protein [Candidatus Thermoplasmatota archaeon]